MGLNYSLQQPHRSRRTAEKSLAWNHPQWNDFDICSPQRASRSVFVRKTNPPGGPYLPEWRSWVRDAGRHGVASYLPHPVVRWQGGLLQMRERLHAVATRDATMGCRK